MSGDLNFDEQLLAVIRLGPVTKLEIFRLVKPGRASTLVMLKHHDGIKTRTAVPRPCVDELRQALEEFQRLERVGGVPSSPPTRPRAFSAKPVTREELIAAGLVKPAEEK